MWTTPPAYTRWASCKRELSFWSASTPSNPALGYLYVEAGDYEKALAFNTEAYDYDDEDSITLDNLAQTYYRLGNDKAKAREFFQKAIELKPTQIDTLYFLAQYDIEEGNKDAAREKLEKALKGRFSPLNYATREMVQASLDSL